jgi:hypothetical protein
MVITAAEARAKTDAVNAVNTRAPVEQVYAQIMEAARSGLGTTVITFSPFTFPSGGSTDPASAPWLNELAGGGFTLTADVDGDGTTRLRVTW